MVCNKARGAWLRGEEIETIWGLHSDGIWMMRLRLIWGGSEGL